MLINRSLQQKQRGCNKILLSGILTIFVRIVLISLTLEDILWIQHFVFKRLILILLLFVLCSRFSVFVWHIEPVVRWVRAARLSRLVHRGWNINLSDVISKCWLDLLRTDDVRIFISVLSQFIVFEKLVKSWRCGFARSLPNKHKHDTV